MRLKELIIQIILHKGRQHMDKVMLGENSIDKLKNLQVIESCRLKINKIKKYLKKHKVWAVCQLKKCYIEDRQNPC